MNHFWYCEVCNAQNHVEDYECQWCEAENTDPHSDPQTLATNIIAWAERQE